MTRPEDLVAAPGMSDYAVNTTMAGIGALEAVTVDDVREARRLAAEHLSTVTRQLAEARLHLLRAGFGSDHPMCLRLDALHQRAADLLADLR